MSFRSLLDRTVTLIPTGTSGEDAHGNDVVVDGAPVEGVKTARELAAGDEQANVRDTISARWLYFFLPDVELTGYDRIVDGLETLNIVGPPELVVRRRGGRPHHWEVFAETP